MNYTDRQINITPKTVALLKENLLNEIAEILYDQGEISNKFIFAIDYDDKRWRRFERNILNPESTRIQGVLTVTGSTPVSGDFLQYTEFYMLTFLSTYKHRDELEIIFREYHAYEALAGKIDIATINGIKYTISKNIDGSSMPNKTDGTDGSGEDKAYYYLTDNWTYSVYVLNSEDLEVTIDGNKIEYSSLIHDINKTSLASSNKTTIGRTIEDSVNTDNTISLVLPLLSTNLAQINIFKDSRKRNLINKVYNIKIKLENEIIFEDDMEMIHSAFTDTKPSPLVFSVMFQTKGNYQRIQIKKSTDSIYQDLDYSEFRFEKSISGPQDAAVLEDISVKTLPAILSRTLYLLVPLEKDRAIGNITVDLEIDTYSDDIEALYDIKINKHGIDIVYEMLLINSVISYSSNADEYIGLTFSDRRDL